MENNYNDYYHKIGRKYNHIRLDTENDMENVMNIIEKYGASKNLKILDIGCGTGKYGKMMKKGGYQVVGIDKSDSQVNQAKELIESYVADATMIPFDDSSFDICTMIMMIQQLSKKDRIKAIEEAYRVLKKGGLLIIKTCSHEDCSTDLLLNIFQKLLKSIKKDIQRLMS